MAKKLLSIVTAIAATIFIICCSVTLTLNFRLLFYRDIEKLDIPGMSGYSEEMIRRNYDILIDYNNIGGPDTLEFDGLAMSDNGRVHFEEVKDIFVFIEVSLIITAVLSALLIAANIKIKQKSFILWSGILSFSIPIVFCGFIIIAWEKLFITFHLLFFNNDYWIFDPSTDPVIMMLPNEFFMHCAIMILGLIMFTGALLILVYFILKRHSKSVISE